MNRFRTLDIEALAVKLRMIAICKRREQLSSKQKKMNRDLSAESKNTVGRKMKRNSVALTH